MASLNLHLTILGTITLTGHGFLTQMQDPIGTTIAIRKYSNDGIAFYK